MSRDKNEPKPTGLIEKCGHVLAALIGLMKRAVKLTNRFFVTHPKLLLFTKILAVFLIFWGTTWRKTYDPDFGWHLQAGNYIRSHGVPSHDIFTYTARNFRWIDHEWLSDVFVSKIYGVFGYDGLVIIFAAIWTAALFIVKAHKKFIFLLAAALAVLSYSGVRATTWTVLFLSILIAIKGSKRKYLKYFLPLLFLIWANIHGGFFIGLIVLGFYFVKERRAFWLYILIASIVATFINPYGPRLYDEIFRTIFDSRAHWQIQEWLPAAFLFYSVAFFYCCLWAIGYLVKYGSHPKGYIHKLSPWFFVASLSSNRHFPLFVLVSAPELDGLYKNIKTSLPKDLNRPRKLLLAVFPIMFVAAMAINIFNIAVAVPNGQHRTSGYPIKAVQYLTNNPCPGNIFNNYNFGGFLIWQLPDTPVYIDGRIPVWRDENNTRYFDRYNKIAKDKNAVESADFKHYNVRCVLWSNDRKTPPVIQSIEGAGWKKVDAASDLSSSLWVAP